MTTDEAIWQSAQNLLKSSKNLDKLWESFDAIICNIPKELVVEFDDCAAENNEWLYPVWEKYCKVKQAPNGKMKGTGWITLAIQLTCTIGIEGDWSHGRRAKVLVGYSPRKDFDDAWEFDSDNPNSAGYVEDCVTGDYRWIHSDEKRWFFAVPLDVLTGTEEVEACIASPMHRILRGEDPDEVLKEISASLCLPPRP